ncbi:HU family DNA-binding protein [Mycoplasma sp. ES3157-GEN-MYC]|uniref:HU family DNA-binding protein n=1 Tax=Mycoplasma miroungigenitalium TaxID=754515 RepID=A0A6M4JBK1_9MOLU|nr:HU family DNA-binding protein [Mycoplasma miroungigenitalium]MBU4690365.1 HU family DNA-binding protein [Mycoplasma miroungigenitalium]MBU4691632.1 HU family DNA-binding protein [Mycoplasma miroungigenitalium]QJR43457.1 HU family DNA-binding protein [Mycoplasma miroungigenitalium]
MTKKEFVAEVAELMDVPVRVANDFFDKFVFVLKERLTNDEKVQLSSLGTFETSIRKGRETLNPFTKESITIEQKRVVKFKPSKYLKDVIN